MNRPKFTIIQSPVGMITVVAEKGVICGLYNEGQKYWPDDSVSWVRDDGKVFDAAREWLDSYFSGEIGARVPEFVFSKGTDFQRQVWHGLLAIRAGETISYGGLATKIGNPKAVRAVGAAVGRNPISIMVPCHRVVGGGGSLTGYAGGLEKKRWLLDHEATPTAPASSRR